MTQDFIYRFTRRAYFNNLKSTRIISGNGNISYIFLSLEHYINFSVSNVLVLLLYGCFCDIYHLY